MIHGHDFKYQIPEMDLLLGIAADAGIFFDHDGEITHDHGDKGEYVIQTVTGSVGGVPDTAIQLMVTGYNAQKREAANDY